MYFLLKYYEVSTVSTMFLLPLSIILKTEPYKTNFAWCCFITPLSKKNTKFFCFEADNLFLYMLRPQKVHDLGR